VKIGHYIPAYNEQVNVNIMSQTLMDSIQCANAGHEYRFWAQHSCDLIAMRNQTLNRALVTGLDYLFMQDSDVFSDAPGGPLLPLLEVAEHTGATITAALVSMRTDPPRANVWPVRVGEVYEAEKVGTGMVLLNLNKIREWYDEYQGPCFQRVYEDDRAITPKIGSDIFFSYVVRDHGGTIVCDARIPTTHVNGVHRLRYDGQRVPTDTAESVEATEGLVLGMPPGA
jgi:hypothetical protein